MEDVQSVIDGRPELGSEVQQVSLELRTYLKEEWTLIIKDRNFDDWLDGFTPMHADNWSDILRSRIKSLVQSAQD